MNMVTTTVRARRVNNNPALAVEHMTLTRIVNEPEDRRVFGWATRDDGEEVYVPASLVKQHQMTSADEGAGMTARCMTNPRSITEPGTAQWVAGSPVTWDGEAEEVEIEVADAPTTVVEDQSDLNKLADGCDDMMVDVVTELDKVVEEMRNMEFRDAMKRVNDVRNKVEAFRSWIDEVAPSNGD